MLKTLQLSTVGRLSLALAVVLALVATGALIAVRATTGPTLGRANAALDAIRPQTAAAQGIVPTPPGAIAAPMTGILVFGDGQATGTPDVAYVNLGVQSDGQTARQAMDANATTMAAVIAAVKGAGIADNDIRTTGLTLTPITSQPKPGDQTPPQVVSYRATNGVTVTVNDVAKTGAVLDAAVSAGANTASGVRFAIKDESALRQKALDAAGHDARAKADALAASLGVHVTGVQSVVEQSGAVPLPREVQPLAASAAPAAAPPPVQPGELTLRVRVQVTFNYA
jgi:hypothetical protein